MPVYEYQCIKCGDKFEAFQKMSDAPIKKCKKCKGKVEKLISSSGFVLKGSGWYVTDYPSESMKKGIAAEKKTSEPKEAAKTKPSESKASSETKPSSKPKPSSTEK